MTPRIDSHVVTARFWADLRGHIWTLDKRAAGTSDGLIFVQSPDMTPLPWSFGCSYRLGFPLAGLHVVSGTRTGSRNSEGEP